jgi:hypothetical protein
MSINKFIISIFIKALILSTCLLSQTPAIYINELLASNMSAYPDMVDFADFSDWIELYNNEDFDVNISGFYITDNLEDPAKWQFPPNTMIPAKGFLLVWADDFNDIAGQVYIRDWWPDNISFTTQWNHTNFKLAKEGDFLALFNPSLLLVDSVTFTAQATDISFGRQPDGGNNWYFFGEPTPENRNTTAALSNYLQTEALVVFSPDGGFYSENITVSMAPSDGSGIIRYTLDGSLPLSSSTQYTTPLILSGTGVIRARVFEEEKAPGPVRTNSYILENTRNLPAFSIVTKPDWLMGRNRGIYRNTLKEREIPVNLSFYPLQGGLPINQDVGVRIGGENIYRFAQKPLNIYARSKYGESHIHNPLFNDQDYAAYKRLYLRNSGDDWPETMVRDGLIVSLLKGNITNSMQNYRPAVLYMNGEYWGIYNLREKIDEEYFSQHHNTDPVDLDHLEANNTVIAGDATEFINLLSFASDNDLSIPENYSYIKSQIDIQSLMDFIIVQDYIANTSWGHNREVWRNRRDGLWQWVLVDMDRGFNGSRISRNLLNDLFTDFRLFRDLCSNQEFIYEFVQRYSYHLDHTFNPQRVTAFIDSLKYQIEPEMPRHIAKWGNYIDSLSIDEWGQTAGISSMTSWNNDIQELKDFANQRTDYAIGFLSERFELNGRSVLSIVSDQNDNGRVSVNRNIFNFGTEHLYFNNVPLTIKAFPPPGYGFLRWKESISSQNVTLIPSNSTWKYFDSGNLPAENWHSNGFYDASWNAGSAILGYGDGDISTLINFGGNPDNKYITSYFRHQFEIENPTNVTELSINLLRDDGAIIYINGIEVIRSNLSGAAVTPNTLATDAVSGSNELLYYPFTINNSTLVTGLNTIAVEVHQVSPTSSDLRFDLSLNAFFSGLTETERIISTSDSITYTLTGDSRLAAEYTEISSSILAQNINSNLVLQSAASPYFVTENVTINPNAVLTVEEGVEIFISSQKSITVNGQLNINGALTNPVTITSYYPNEQWGAILFDNSTGESVLNNIRLSKATNGTQPDTFFAAISILNSSVTLNNIEFNDCTIPISSQWSNLVINNCTFENITRVGDFVNVNGGNLTISNSVFMGNGISDMDAIDIGFMTGTTIIENNIIRNFSGENTDGIDIGDESENVIIRNNTISDMRDKGISIGQGSIAIISNNTISNCNLGIGIKDSLSFAEVRNNTFYANTIAVSCYEKVLNRGGGTAYITNSIISNSLESSIFTDPFSEITISYSISNTDSLQGQGNIFGEAFIINPAGGNFNLAVNSPAINSGDPSATDNDGSRIDIGAIPFKGARDPLIVINEINYNSADEFDSEDWIELYNPYYSTVDISGWVIRDESVSPSFEFPAGTSLGARSYIVVCRDDILFKNIYPDVSNYFNGLDNGFNGNGESLFLYNQDGYLVDSLTYDDQAPWPVNADGGGHSLELTDAYSDNAMAESWTFSSSHGTPGKVNSKAIVNLDEQPEIPLQFSISQNFPNPFNPSTKISFTIPIKSYSNISIYDINGRKIKTIVSENLDAGYYEHIWDGTNKSGNLVNSGMYFIRMHSAHFNKVIKALLIK